MRIVLLTLLAVAAATSQPYEVKIDQAANEDALKHFTAILGEDLINTATNKIKKRMSTCLEISVPDKHRKILDKCFRKVLKVDDFNFSTNYHLASQKEYINFYRDLVYCELDALGIQYTSNTIDKNQLLAAVKSEKWSTSTEKSEAFFHGILDQCAAAITGDKPVYQQIYKSQLCIVEHMISSCEFIGKEPGLIPTIMKGFYSIMEPPKCNGFTVPKTLTTDVFTECLAEANAEWTAEDAYDGSMLNHDIRDKIRDAFYFFKRFGEKILGKTAECVAAKTEIYDKEKGIMYDKLIATLGSFDWKQNKWSNDMLVHAIHECRTDKVESQLKVKLTECQLEPIKNDTHVEYILSEENKHKEEIAAQILKFHLCFAPKYVNICGFNNDLTTFMYPFLNNELGHKVIEDFKYKKGSNAILHMISVFRDQFVDWVKMLTAYELNQIPIERFF